MQDLQESNNSGICNVDTAELDGESNLKIYQGFEEVGSVSCPVVLGSPFLPRDLNDVHGCCC